MQLKDFRGERERAGERGRRSGQDWPHVHALCHALQSRTVHCNINK